MHPSRFSGAVSKAGYYGVDEDGSTFKVNIIIRAVDNFDKLFGHQSLPTALL